MPSREENRKAAKELLARCAEQGVKVPTVRAYVRTSVARACTLCRCCSALYRSDTVFTVVQNAVNAAVEAGTMLNATREQVTQQKEQSLVKKKK